MKMALRRRFAFFEFSPAFETEGFRAYRQEKYAKFGAEHFAEASRQAVVDMAADINSVL